ncbi:GNAT family N-acetyltransferase [Bacillus inaquosorum]|uniref:GNAT family N-acetyltransferase n=1 Tax=Bacillus inaquosorum TaxID=483913 RepID=A0A9Q4ETR7_9BACI|nr:GNAT family N-acetyltransferase [Bacillus inaquosorum]MCY7786027.1 GNAT family N-acetyltransferase [Bacillus inaquosorum]MCY7818159.1 GNAT family N-acetyltransferase [Bacillus inaquosorum]MCY7936799.1 GNAT family N-acetyltransferase [Bacillus inaquosorum]MCY8082398.1 GNAT family N-acetyltransferase [Bacillus inaquosorum]MCY8171590.1 GNAT family N-acetyltransferase [Bacillus inaquosorum]
MDVMDELIELHEEHVPGLLRLCRQAGWPDYGEQELALLVQQGRFFGYQNIRGEIISCIGLFLFGRLASIGLVIVDKEYKRLGLGRRMVNACIPQTDKSTAIRLCATKEGLPLYEKAGFHKAGSVRKYSCHSFQPFAKHLDAELTSFREQDFQDLAAADLAAFGGDRSNLLQQLISTSEECVIIRNKKGQLIGYGLSVQTPANLKFGPIVAPSSDIAARIINRLAAGKQSPMRIDIPGEHTSLHDRLIEMGFHADAELPLMLYQKKRLPDQNGHLYSLISQALG